jgi:lysophospholipase L1-like esterase
MSNLIRKLVALVLVPAVASLSFIPLAQAKRVAVYTGYNGATYTYNISAANTSSFRTVANAHVRNALIYHVSDSTGRGTDETASPYNTQYPNAMPMQLTTLLNNAGIASGANNWYGLLSSLAASEVALRDYRVTTTGASTSGTVLIAGGNDLSFPTAASTFSFTPQAACSSADIYWRNSTTTGRIFSYAVDGGSATNLSTTTSPANTIVKTTIPLGSAAIHTITLTWVASNPSIFGIDCQDLTRTEITNVNWGIPGATTSNIVNNTNAPNGGRLQQLTQFPPDLVIGELGLINSWRTSVSVAQSKADMTLYVQTAKTAGANVILLVPPYDNGSAGLTANQNAYVQAMYQVAAEQGVGLIDIRKKWISFANAVANGWQVNSDPVHPTKAGYLDEAQVVYNVIQSILQNKFAANDNEPLPIEHDNGLVTKAGWLFRDREAANDNATRLPMVG